MEDNKRSKIEIININIDINIDEEIKKQTNVDELTKSKINNVIERAKMRQGAHTNQGVDEFDNKFEALFTVMSADNVSLTKEDFMNRLNITGEQLGAYISKFRKFLKDAKDNKWVLVLGKNENNKRIYMLKRYQ
ncbi:MAG: hypothetical protein QXP41_00575 [Candidatus Nitrosocaldus sp.]